MLKNELNYIKSATDFEPEIAIVLGSGLGELAEDIEQICTINYADIPDFPVSTAPGHKGRFVFGMLGEKKVAAMQGRFHLYEGYSPFDIVKPLRLLKMLGSKVLLLTNAAGGINPDFRPGDFMLISDHISCFVPSPLEGKNDDSLGVRFPDMSNVYSKRLNKIIENTAAENDIDLKRGVYLQLRGPNFETPAEIKMAKYIGADAVGMSTTIEAQAAVHCGFEVCGISLISNLACGISEKPLSSEEVDEAGKNAAPVFKKLVRKAVGNF